MAAQWVFGSRMQLSEQWLRTTVLGVIWAESLCYLCNALQRSSGL